MGVDRSPVLSVYVVGCGGLDIGTTLSTMGERVCSRRVEQWHLCQKLSSTVLNPN